jgi:hypothetical protein
MLTAAWNAVKSETIANCFRKTGFNCSDRIEIITDAAIKNEEEWSAVASGSSTNYEEFLKCDDGVITTSMQQDVEAI